MVAFKTVWVPRIELGSSGRKASAFNHEGTSLALENPIS